MLDAWRFSRVSISQLLCATVLIILAASSVEGFVCSSFGCTEITDSIRQGNSLYSWKTTTTIITTSPTGTRTAAVRSPLGGSLSPSSYHHCGGRGRARHGIRLGEGRSNALQMMDAPAKKGKGAYKVVANNK